MLLFFDTETSGLPRNHRAPASDLGNWPRLVQLAWLLTDEQGNPIDAAEAIIRPEGFLIPNDAVAVHGISTARAIAAGQPLGSVLQRFCEALQQADAVVAHNIAFDEKVVGAELLRTGLSNPLEGLPRHCTMLASTELCELPGPCGWKWPKLEELHQRLFGQAIPGAHNALVDVQACARCFFELRRLGLLA